MFHSQLTKSSSALVTSHKQESCLDSRHDVHPWWIRATVTMMIDIELNRFPVRIRSSAKYPFWSATLLFEPLRKQYKRLLFRQRLRQRAMHIQNVPRCELLEGKPRQFACEEVPLARCLVYFWLEHSLWAWEVQTNFSTIEGGTDNVEKTQSPSWFFWNPHGPVDCPGASDGDCSAKPCCVKVPFRSEFCPQSQAWCDLARLFTSYVASVKAGMLIWMALIRKIEETDWKMYIIQECIACLCQEIHTWHGIWALMITNVSLAFCSDAAQNIDGKGERKEGPELICERSWKVQERLSAWWSWS